MKADLGSSIELYRPFEHRTYLGHYIESLTILYDSEKLPDVKSLTGGPGRS
jgi:hypothetical protein